jgi:hypothetical protein
MKARVLIELLSPLVVVVMIWIATLATKSSMDLALALTAVCATVFTCVVGCRLILK